MTPPEAAVAIVRAQCPEPAVLLMRRAERDGDPWSGHWSFPGGHIEEHDENLLHAAIRELREECGVFVTEADLAATLPAAVARRKEGRYLTVAPFVFELRDRPAVTVDFEEAVEGRWVPLSLLTDPRHHRLQPVPGMPEQILFPTVDLPVVPLWGFTYRLIAEWLALTPPAADADRSLRELVDAGQVIPAERAAAYLTGDGTRVPPLNALEIRPGSLRVVGLSFEEFVIQSSTNG